MSVIIVPNAASLYTSDTAVPNSANRWGWLGFVAGPGGSGCCIWNMGTACANASPILPIVAASGHQTVMAPTPFVAACGFFASCIVGGSAVIWLKSGSRGGG